MLVGEAPSRPGTFDERFRTAVWDRSTCRDSAALGLVPSRPVGLRVAPPVTHIRSEYRAAFATRWRVTRVWSSAHWYDWSRRPAETAFQLRGSSDEYAADAKDCRSHSRCFRLSSVSPQRVGSSPAQWLPERRSGWTSNGSPKGRRRMASRRLSQAGIHPEAARARARSQVRYRRRLRD